MRPAPDATRTVFRTYLMTDIVGSTVLWRDNPTEMSHSVKVHNEIITRAVEDNGGHLVRTKGEGDSSLSVYENPIDALVAALQIQVALATEEWPAPTNIVIRAALTMGYSEAYAGDYLGTSLNLTARIRAVANPGQTLSDQSVRDACESISAKDVTWKDLGQVTLRDFGAKPLHQVACDGLRTDFPRLSASVTKYDNIPESDTAFVGREPIVADVLDSIHNNRLTLLTGPSGSGKTRILKETARRAMPEFENGCVWVPLDLLSSEGEIETVVAAALGLDIVTPSSLESEIVAILSEKQVLLLLDNCEHVVSKAGRFIRTILSDPQLSKVTIAATSQRTLQVGESVRAIPPMDLGPVNSSGNWALIESQRLFVELVRRSINDFEPTPAEVDLIARIVRRLDGLPLAIQLAASKCGTLYSLQELFDRLDRRFIVLGTSEHETQSRHSTMWNALDWSYELLSENDQELFAKLSVFEGGFTFSSIEQVMSLSRDKMDLAEHGVASLIRNSLVVREEGGIGESRFRMLETLRAFARERLGGMESELRDAHANYFCSLVTQRADEFRAGRLKIDIGWYLQNQADISRGLVHALGQVPPSAAAFEALANMEPIWRHFGGISEGRAQLEQALESLPTGMLKQEAMLATAAGVLAWKQGELSKAKPLLLRAYEASEKVGDPSRTSNVLCAIGLVKWSEDDFEGAAENFEAAHLQALRAQDKRALGNASNNLGILRERQDRLEMAAHWLFEAIKHRKEIGDEMAVAESLVNLALVREKQLDFDQALELTREASVVFSELGSVSNSCVAVHNLGNLYRRTMDFERARECNDESLRLSESIGDKAGVAHYWLLKARIEQDSGETEAAVMSFVEALRKSLAEPYGVVVDESLACLSAAMMALGQFEFSAQILGFWSEVAKISPAQACERFEQWPALSAELGAAQALDLAEKCTGQDPLARLVSIERMARISVRSR